jgi:threonine aldolase
MSEMTKAGGSDGETTAVTAGEEEPSMEAPEQQTAPEAKRLLARPSATMSLGERLAALIEQAPGAYDLSLSTDVYGDGVVSEVENRVAKLLGKEDAAFFPTGTMAQQVVLRCWAERTGNSHVALHALSHPEVFEADAFRRVSNLNPLRLTGAPRQVTGEEVLSCTQEFGTLMLELPLRDAGYLLPTWDELVEVTQAARERDAVVHFDGARLFECTTHFERPLQEIASLADTVYVSLYKSLDGLSGAVVAGPSSLIKEARIWRHRYGGRVFHQFPAALSALVGLDRELPRLPEYVAHAKAVARAMAQGFEEAGVGWSKVQPEVPHIHQFQAWLPFPAEKLNDAAARQVRESGAAVFQMPWWEPGLPPGISVTEVTVSEAGLDWAAAEVRDAVIDFVRHIAP